MERCIDIRMAKRRLGLWSIAAPVEIVVAHFAGRPFVAKRASYKSEKKPEALARQTFLEAVASSGLKDEQKSFLMSIR
jgi:hypothetical protein